MAYPRVQFTTEVGEILAELYSDRAPITTENFLRYVDEERFAGTVFYRVVRMDNQPKDSIKIDVIQGGLKLDHHPKMLPPIPHETTQQTCLLHQDGTLSMARDEPGTASSEFFICVGAQPELDFGGKRNPDGSGFAAFGKVIEGMDVVRAIHQSPAREQDLEPNIKILGVKLLND